MTPDQLLAEMQLAHIGRPSTCARSLYGLEKKGLLEMPIQGGQLRLTPSGVATALALEACEPSLSSPAFCAHLSQQLELIERGDLGPREVLGQLLPVLVPDCPDMDDVRSRVWNSLAELEQAQQAAQAISRGGLISAVTDGAQPA
jgi:DNA topoisomerase IA